MDCPLCVRQLLLANLKLQPQNQELRLKLVTLLACKEDQVKTGYNYQTDKEHFCKPHRHWIQTENFLNVLNRRETITLLFGETTKRPN